jgi:hypothetical protein
MLPAVLCNKIYIEDWRPEIAKTGHPFLKKVLRHIPGLIDGSNEKAEVGEHESRKYGLYTDGADSLSIFPRQVNEHGKSKVNICFFLFSVSFTDFHNMESLR